MQGISCHEIPLLNPTTETRTGTNHRFTPVSSRDLTSKLENSTSSKNVKRLCYVWLLISSPEFYFPARIYEQSRGGEDGGEGEGEDEGD